MRGNATPFRANNFVCLHIVCIKDVINIDFILCSLVKTACADTIIELSGGTQGLQSMMRQFQQGAAAHAPGSRK